MGFCGEFDALRGKNGANALCLREYFDETERKLHQKTAAQEFSNRH
jgi:hypothetical protein